MSTITYCDGCGIELGKGKGIYHAQIRSPDDPYSYDTRYDLCTKCAKPLLAWKIATPRADPIRKKRAQK